MDDYLKAFPDTNLATRAQLRRLLSEVGNADEILEKAIDNGVPPSSLVLWLDKGIKKQQKVANSQPVEKVAEPEPTKAQPYAPKEEASAEETEESAEEKPTLRDRLAGLPWMWIGIGILVLALIVAAIWFFGGSSSAQPTAQSVQPSQTQPEQRSQPETLLPPEAPPVVNLQPIDYKSVAFVGVTLFFMFIAGTALIPLGILDAKERLQVSDISVALAGLLANYVAIWKPFVAFWTTLVPIFNEQSTAVTFGILITGIVVTKAVTGGRDTTNLGVYFGELAIIGAISGNMGAFQAAFNIPYQPVYMLQGLPSAIMAKQASVVQYSLLVYSVLFLAIGAYLLDIVYPREKKPRYGAFFSFAAVVGTYYLALLAFNAQYALFFGISAGVLAAVIARKTGNVESAGENKLTKIVQRVFEYTPWDGACLGIVVLVLLRLAGLA